MNKDAILATLIGFGIGLLITGLLLVGPNLLRAFPKFAMPQNTSAPTPTPTPAAFTVTVDSPLPDAIESTEELLVTGTTTEPGATIIIGGFADELAVVAGSDGKFAGRVTLVEGKNDITVTAYAGTKQTTVSVTVYYTPEPL